jgi:hypothetical protein
MKSLVFKEVSILSKAEKAAVNLTFVPTVNLLTGENDVGKSTLIKSLYHTLGADVPQLQNSRWKRARPIYCVKVAMAGSEYTIIRDEKYFGVFDTDRKLVGRYTGISGENGIARFINPKLGFRIELERAADSGLGPAGPAFYFLPFYVDQDEGWNRSWASFLGLPQFKDYRRSMIEYHLGVRPQSYYDAKKRQVELSGQLLELSRERETLAIVRESYHKRKVMRQVDLDPSVFKQEAEELVAKFNEVNGHQQKILHELKEARSERHAIETEMAILKRAISELDADYALAESPTTPDPICCPTCSTEFTNSITERFGLLEDIDYCYELLDQRIKKRIEVQQTIAGIEERYGTVTKELDGIQELLQRTRQNITFAELVSSEGIKDMLQSINLDIADLVSREDALRAAIARLAGDLKVDAKHKKQIVAFYQARMKEYLDGLNVHVLETNDYKSLDRQIKNNALGSDLPRSLLAQYLAFLHTMKEYNNFVMCPLVLDSPLQQEQDPTNIDAIFKFIFSKVLHGQQLILATLSTSGASPGTIPADAKVHVLSEKYRLLHEDQFDRVNQDLGLMHEQTLAS